MRRPFDISLSLTMSQKWTPRRIWQLYEDGLAVDSPLLYADLVLSLSSILLLYLLLIHVTRFRARIST